MSCDEPSPGPMSPTPSTPSLVGNWTGTLTVEQIVPPEGPRIVNVCNETWTVTTQTEGRFAGTFQASGGTVTRCTEAGSLAGTVSTSGEIASLTFNPPVGSPSDTSTCRRVSGDGVYTGRLDGASLTAQTAERALCIAGGAGLQFDRTFRLSMNRGG